MACPTCGEEGQYFQGAPRDDLDHYSGRAIWALHAARRAAERLGLLVRAAMISALIHELEEAEEVTKPHR